METYNSNSPTTTIAGGEESKRQSKHEQEPSPTAPGTTAAHDDNAPDLSFPFQSTNTAEGGFTNEYRTVSRTGFIPADTALRPVPSHVSATPPALRDPEKARELKDVKLVTFVPNDPEDPRNLARWFKWCKWCYALKVSIYSCLSSRYHLCVRLLRSGSRIRIRSRYRRLS